MSRYHRAALGTAVLASTWACGSKQLEHPDAGSFECPGNANCPAGLVCAWDDICYEPGSVPPCPAGYVGDGVSCEVIPPPARAQHAIAYDVQRQRLVLFGGVGLTYMNDTWEFDGELWVERAPAHVPAGRVGHRMVYDDARGRVVLFGGRTPDPAEKNDTWEWDGSDWTEVTTSGAPPARSDHAMTYDAVRERVIVFGGFGAPFEDGTWEFDGTQWIELAQGASPPPRFGATMSHDTERGQAILFGGTGVGNFDDTWQWNGTVWTQATPVTAPPGRYLHAAAYDEAHARVVIFGGTDGTAEGDRRDTWEWDGSDWSEAAPSTSPSPRSSHTMAYDGLRGQVILQGGCCPMSDDMWLWDGISWISVR